MPATPFGNTANGHCRTFGVLRAPGGLTAPSHGAACRLQPFSYPIREKYLVGTG